MALILVVAGKKNLILSNAGYNLRRSIARLCCANVVIKIVRLLGIETLWNEQTVYSTAG